MGSVPRVDWTKVDHVLLDMDGTLLDLAFDNDFWGHQIHAHYAALNKLSYDAAVRKFEPLFRSVEGTLSWYSTDHWSCLLYTSPSPRDRQKSRMPSSA